MTPDSVDNTVLIALIAGLTAIITSTIAAIVTVRTLKVSRDTRTEVSAMHGSVNSKMDALLKEARELAEIRGMLKERESVAASKAADK